jgi:acetylcholinesterase
MFTFFLLSLTVQATLGANSAQCGLPASANDPRLVNTLNGRVKGSCQRLPLIDPDVGNRTEWVVSWQGIPFAQPPVGPLRFMSPKPSLNWNNTLIADNYSNMCVQGTGGDEDCLYLNVYAPAKQSKKPLSVYVYIHGGGLVGGSAATGRFLNAVAISDFILVTFNYRLGPFGFMYLPEVGITGNMALLDQKLALQWVQDNIAKFNGDPKRVTIGGSSAGAWSIGFHLVHKPSWPLFTNAILLSGSSVASKLALLTPEEASKRTSGVFESMGCPRSLGYAQRRVCIQNRAIVQTSQLIPKTGSYISANVLRGKASGNLNPAFHFVMNGIEFNETIKDSFANGRFKSNVNIINGHTRDEGGYYFEKYFKPNEPYVLDYARFSKYLDKFYYYYPTYPKLSNTWFRNRLVEKYTKPNQTNYLPSLIQMLGESVYICPIVDFTKFYSSQSSSVRVYRYLYDYLATTSSATPAFGVAHGETGQMWNGQALGASRKNTWNERVFSKKLVTYWTNFIKYGNPNVYDPGVKPSRKNIEWPAYVSKNWISQPELNNLNYPYDSYLSLRLSNITVSSDSKFMNCDIWKSYNSLPSSY